MKIWIDDVRPAPEDEGYVWVRSVNRAVAYIEAYEVLENRGSERKIELLDIDHDAGDYVDQGGDYINLLNWLEETGRNYPIHIHSMNPVGVENMRRIIRRNGWQEV